MSPIAITGLIDFVRNLMGKKRIITEDNKCLIYERAADVAVRELALASAINLIANTLNKCEFKTFLGGKENKGREYYLLNVSPNDNDNAQEFRRKLVWKLYMNNECLIVDIGGKLLVADSFNLKNEYAVYPNLYDGVCVNGFEFKRDFRADEVLYLRNSSVDVRKLVVSLYRSYEKLIQSAKSAVTKTRGEKGILKVDSTRSGEAGFEETYRKMIDERLKNYFEADNAAFPQFAGYEYIRNGNDSTRSLADVGDVRKLTDDIYDATARAFIIPPALLRGEMADVSSAVHNYLTFCIDPLCEMIQSEINRKRWGYSQMQKGNYMKIDTSRIGHFDILADAANIDKLISSGVFSINDILISLGKAAISEPWADRHFITKNYTLVQALAALEGGEND